MLGNLIKLCCCYKSRTENTQNTQYTNNVVSLAQLALGRGGTNSSIFLNIGDTFDPQVVLGVVLCIKDEINF